MPSASNLLLPYPKPPRPPLPLQYSGLRLVHPLLRKTPPPFHPPKRRPSSIYASSTSSSFPSSPTPPPLPPRPPPTAPTTVPFAGRSKKNKKSSGGRIEGSGDVRREAKARARVRSRRLTENAFYRRNKRAASGQADAFTDEELEMIGLGYDRAVRFMSGPDDPQLRHPHDWYKYGRYGPYSWRGIVVGPPIRGRFSDDRVSLMSEVHDHEEWDRIEQFDMSNQFSNRLNELDASVGFRYYWVFVRHPKWRPSELPWEQWTLSAEVAVQARRDERLDKWSLMGRLGNRTRELITKCAAWTRPDIIYVKRPLYQSRFEPQEDFFRQLRPLVDPATENGFLFDLEHDGRVVRTTYFGGLCKIVRANPKAYVDDVVNAYSKLSDVDKSRCLEFLLKNHPMELLHPYTKEWKVKLEEMELGCDAPDGSDDEDGDESKSEVIEWIEDDGDDEDGDESKSEVIEWIEDNGDDDGYEGEDNGDGSYEDEVVIDVREEADVDEVESKEENEEYWDGQWKKAMRSSDKMEKLVKRSMEESDKYHKRQMEQEKEMAQRSDSANTMVIEREQIEEGEQESSESRIGKGRMKSKIPPVLFLRAAVRPFTYRNLVKEIVLMRHIIIDGDIGSKN